MHPWIQCGRWKARRKEVAQPWIGQCVGVALPSFADAPPMPQARNQRVTDFGEALMVGGCGTLLFSSLSRPARFVKSCIDSSSEWECTRHMFWTTAAGEESPGAPPSHQTYAQGCVKAIGFQGTKPLDSPSISLVADGPAVNPGTRKRRGASGLLNPLWAQDLRTPHPVR